MLEAILDSKVKIKIGRLFSKRQEPLQVSDVARLCKISKSRASECLRELAEKGILESKTIGRSVIYSPSSTNLSKTILKSLAQDEIILSDIEKELVSKASRIGDIVTIALFGSALKGLKLGSDVDFLILYKRLRKDVYRISSELTEKFGFRISILSMALNEFKLKAKRGEEIVINIIANHKTIYGKDVEDLIW